ncbi:hypothetical protein K1W54_34730 [Micromonospora sp. CPCC 205371]|nr:hypothetical protein [Micromonospora sp. CPCC 205371]
MRRAHAVETLDAELGRAVRRASLMRQGFYVVVLLVALAGQVSGAVEALGIPLAAAIPAVGALELGGIVVLANADVRRRLGERAIGSRLLSAAIAVGAVAFNWLAHSDHLLGGFFAGMSALGYLVWLTHTENQRRDRLRATGDLPPTTPAYEVGGHWLRHPFLTRRAKSLAKEDPTLGLYGSLAAARAEVASHRRQKAIAKVLHRKIRSAVDPATADIALAVYDLEEIAAGLTRRADYDGLTDLIAIDLAPARLAPRSADLPELAAAGAAALERSASDRAASASASADSAASGGLASRNGASGCAPEAPGIVPVPTRDALGGDRSTWPGRGAEPAASGGTAAVTDVDAPDGVDSYVDTRALDDSERTSPAAPGRPARRPGTPPPSAALTEASAESQVIAAVRRELEELRSPIGTGPDAAPPQPRRRPRATTNRAVSPPPANTLDGSSAPNASNEDGVRAVPPPRAANRRDGDGEPMPRGQSLRRLVHTTLDRHPAADPGRDHTELIDLVTDELQLNDVERITAATYVQTWKRDDTQTALPQQARR